MIQASKDNLINFKMLNKRQDSQNNQRPHVILYLFNEMVFNITSQRQIVLMKFNAPDISKMSRPNLNITRAEP